MGLFAALRPISVHPCDKHALTAWGGDFDQPGMMVNLFFRKGKKT